MGFQDVFVLQLGDGFHEICCTRPRCQCEETLNPQRPLLCRAAASSDQGKAEGGDGQAVAAAAGSKKPPSLRRRMMTEMEDRMVSQGNLVHQAAKNVEEMVKLSEVIKDILKGGADETSRDELDDELSELHMMIGVRLRPPEP
jgi:hypothetical protein